MAIAFVQAATQVQVNGSSTNAPSITLNGTTAGNCLVAVATIGDAADLDFTIANVTDGADTFVVRSGVATDLVQRIYAVVAYAVNITGGNRTIEFNLAGTSGGADRYYTLGCTEWSGVATSSPEDTFDANNDIDSTVDTDGSAGPITTTDAGDLIVGTCAMNAVDAAANFASPASWTNRYRQNDVTTYYGMDSGSWLPGAIQTTYTAQWAHDNGALCETCAVVVALKPAAGGGQPTVNRKLVKTFVSLAGLLAPFLQDRASGLYIRDNRLVVGQLVAA